MSKRHKITIDGKSFLAPRGARLLDVALNNGIDLPYSCRAGHCGTCCVRLVSGDVHGGQGTEPGVIHACQCRIVADAVIEREQPADIRSVNGVLGTLRPLSSEVLEIGITTDRPLPHLPGQYAHVQFSGYPNRSYSITHALNASDDSDAMWFHIRRVDNGRVSASIGKRIRIGHRVRLTGPFGSAHFRPNSGGRIVLVATNTGFAPIWAIAVAALREDPSRRMMVIAGGRTLDALYMAPALVRLARFLNVVVVPVCSSLQVSLPAVRPGRPTDYLPRLLPTDALYACGAPGMVESVRAVSADVGATCYADPFLPAPDTAGGQSPLTRTIERLSSPLDRNMLQLAYERPGGFR